MRVLQLIQHPNLGGLEKMVFSLCANKSQNMDMLFVSLEGKASDAIVAWPELEKLDHFICLDKPPKFSVNTVKKIIQLVDQYKIDIIHSHHVGPLIYSSLVQLRRPNLVHISTIHDAWYLTHWKQRLFTQLVKLFTPVIFVADAQAVADVTLSQANVKSDFVVHNAVDTDFFCPRPADDAKRELSLPRDKTLIGCAARLEAGKGHQALLRTLRYLPSHIHMVFAGDGSQREHFKQYATTLGVKNRTHWLGNVENMPIFYSAIDLFCLFSQREGLPLSILEAMSCNRPVVASDVGGIHEIVSDETGILVPSNNEKQLSNYLMQALSCLVATDIRTNAIVTSSLDSMLKKYKKIYHTQLSLGGQ